MHIQFKKNFWTNKTKQQYQTFIAKQAMILGIINTIQLASYLYYQNTILLIISILQTTLNIIIWLSYTNYQTQQFTKKEEQPQ